MHSPRLFDRFFLGGFECASAPADELVARQRLVTEAVAECRPGTTDARTELRFEDHATNG